MPAKKQWDLLKSLKNLACRFGNCDTSGRWLVPLMVIFFAGFLRAEKLEVIRTIPHSGYSEGLHFHEGFLWHALPTEILKIDPKDGTILQRLKPATSYSESLVWVKNKLWNVSFSDNGIYEGTLAKNELSFKKRGTVPDIHAWGLEYDGKHLVVTGEYSNKLFFLNAKTLKVERTLETAGKDLEDLAWDGKGGFWTSSFTSQRGKIFRVDAKTGKISPYYSLPNPEDCPIIDGIAYDGKNLWLTGKHCPSIYYVKVP